MSRVSTSMPVFRNRGQTRTDFSQSQVTNSKASVCPSRYFASFLTMAKVTSSDGTELNVKTPVDSMPEVVRTRFPSITQIQ